MGNSDSIPVVSQAKSVYQLARGDKEGAKKTFENFTVGCPVVSQVCTLAEAISGDTDAAAERQKKFWKGMGDLADGTPGVGHAKGVIHLAFGDKEGFEKAEKAASRTTGVALGGIGGFVVGGPVGAFAGGVGGGLAVDGLTTGIESAVKDEFIPAGTIATVDSFVKGSATSGDEFDLVFGTVMDGVAGIAAGENYGRRSNLKLKNKRLLKEKGVPSKDVKNLQKNVNSLTGESLREMHQEAKLSHTKFKQAKQSGMSNRQLKRVSRGIDLEHSKHTGNNVHSIYRDGNRLGQISADVQPSVDGAPRGAGRVILQDVNRNYQLHVQDYTPDHNYRATGGAVQRPAYAAPFDYVADHPNVAGGAGLVGETRGSQESDEDSDEDSHED